MKKIFILFTVIFISIARVSWAGSGKGDTLKAFKIFDLNRNGAITRFEGPLAYHWRAGLFDLMDLDHDGKITWKEFSSRHESGSSYS